MPCRRYVICMQTVYTTTSIGGTTVPPVQLTPQPVRMLLYRLYIGGTTVPPVQLTPQPVRMYRLCIGGTTVSPVQLTPQPVRMYRLYIGGTTIPLTLDMNYKEGEGGREGGRAMELCYTYK